jgi:hypothetical protein
VSAQAVKRFPGVIATRLRVGVKHPELPANTLTRFVHVKKRAEMLLASQRGSLAAVCVDTNGGMRVNEG